MIITNSTFNNINNRPGFKGGTFTVDGSFNFEVSYSTFSNLYGGKTGGCFHITRSQPWNVLIHHNTFRNIDSGGPGKILYSV